MAKSAWYDIEMRGRRLEAICKRMNTEFQKAMKEDKIPLALSYHDALLRTEKLLQPYVEQITGLNRFLKKHDIKDQSYIIPEEDTPSLS